MMIIPQLYSSIAGIVNTMPVYIQNLYEWLTGLFANNPPLEEMVLSVYQQAVIAVQDWSASNLIPHLQSIGSFRESGKDRGRSFQQCAHHLQPGKKYPDRPHCLWSIF